MKAVSFSAPKKVGFIDISTLQPGPEEVLVDVGYVGLCGSDLNTYRGLFPPVTYFVRKELDILGSRNALRVFSAVIKMLERREQPCTELISKIYPFEDTAEAFANWDAIPGKFTKSESIDFSYPLKGDNREQVYVGT